TTIAGCSIREPRQPPSPLFPYTTLFRSTSPNRARSFRARAHSGTLTYGALFALGNAVLISTVAIAIRRMSMTESAETLTLYQMSIMTLCTAFSGEHRAPFYRRKEFPPLSHE